MCVCWPSLTLLLGERRVGHAQSWWTPVTGGANVPAINELLAPFGVAFGDAVLRGDLSVGGLAVQLASAAQIVRFPVGGWLVRAASLQDEGAKIAGVLPFMRVRRNVPILGLLQPRAPGAGRLVTFGDSECVDSLAAQQGSAPCWWLLQALLTFACDGRRDPALFPDHLRLLQSLGDSEPLPARAPTLSSAHGDTRSAAADDANPSACLLSRLGLTPAPVGLGRAEWSSLPDEPFGVLAHWPHAAAEPFLPDLSAADLTMARSIAPDGSGAEDSGAGGFGAAHLLATRAASAALVLLTLGAGLFYTFARVRVGTGGRAGRASGGSRSNRGQPSPLKGSRQRGANSAVSSNRLHAV